MCWGELAAQDGEASILQKVREAERDTIYTSITARVGELVTVIVKRAEGPDLIVGYGADGSAAAKREQSKLETYNIGRAVARGDQDGWTAPAKGPQVIVSTRRCQPGTAIIRDEVPEFTMARWQIRLRRGKQASGRK